jgi:anti-anti-sigma factor
MIRSKTAQGKTTLAPEGNVGTQETDAFAKSMDDAAARGDEIEIDLSKCRALSSSALGAMIATHNTLKTRGSRLQVSGANDEIRRLLKLMQLDRHFEVA